MATAPSSSASSSASAKGPNARILAIALPAILANSAAPMVGLLDSWTLANFAGTRELAAIGAGSTVFSFLLWAFGFLRMGTTGMVAQAAGKRDHEAISQLTVQSLAIGFGLGLIILLLAWPLLIGSLALLQLPQGVTAAYETYFLIRIVGSPLTLATYGITGVLLGQERARGVLVLQLVLNCANGALNLLFVIGFGMGAGGVALGTVIAEALTFGVGMLLILHGCSLADLTKALKAKATWSIDALSRLIKVNGLLFIRTIALLSVFFVVTRQAAQFGEAALAASHIFNTFLLLISLGLDAFAYAAEALAGAAYGDGNRRDFHQWSLRCGVWSVGTSLVYVALFWFGGTTIIAMLIPEDGAAVAALLSSVLWMLAIMPIIGVWSYLFDGIYVGATASLAMAVTMGLSAMGFFALLPRLIDAYGVEGIWLTLLIFLGLRGLFQGIWYPWIAKSIHKA